MELENKDILERSVSEKMCSSGSNGVGEICSPGTADTCGDGLFAVKEIKSSAEKWRISGLFVRLVSRKKPCGKFGFIVWKHICFGVWL